LINKSLSIITFPLKEESFVAFNVVITADGVVNVPVNVGEANNANVPVTEGNETETADVLLPIKETLPLVVTFVELPNVKLLFVVDIDKPLIVLPVNDSVPAKVANVPDVGNVIFVAAVEIIVVG